MTAGLPCLVEMKVFSYDNTRLSDIPVDVLVYDHTGSQVESDISCDDDKVYQLVFTPQMKGDYRLVATFRGHPISGAEETFMCGSNDPVARFGEFGEGCGV